MFSVNLFAAEMRQSTEGIAQVFRRDESPYETARFRLSGLDPEATYRLRDFDRAGPATAGGRDLREKGLLVSLPQRRSSCIIGYQRETPAGVHDARGHRRDRANQAF